MGKPDRLGKSNPVCDDFIPTPEDNHCVASGVLTELSYASALRALDLQERSVEQLRARAGMLLAASSLIASVLGSRAIEHVSGLGATLYTFALLSLGGSVCLCVYVLLPKPGLVFSISAPNMYEQLRGLADDNVVRKRLIYWLEAYWQGNQRQIDRLNRCFFAGAIGLLLQLAFGMWISTGSVV